MVVDIPRDIKLCERHALSLGELHNTIVTFFVQMYFQPRQITSKSMLRYSDCDFRYADRTARYR